MLLNGLIYESKNDGLIYDASHPIDADNVKVSLDVQKVGTLKRGTLLDISEDAKQYSVHKEKGIPCAIVALDTSCAETDTEVVVPVYTSGAYKESGIRTDVPLTEADKETLREKGIVLK